MTLGGLENDWSKNQDTGEFESTNVRVPQISALGWKKVQNIFELLEPLKEATLAMSSRNVSSAHTVICSIEAVRDTINTVEEEHSSAENEAADAMGIKFNKYYADNVMPKQFIIANILDPRIKLHWAKSQDETLSRTQQVYSSSSINNTPSKNNFTAVSIHYS